MAITKLSLLQFRCFNQQELTPHPHCNLIIGANASGKTSLLESLYILSNGKSFRTHKTEPLIQSGEKYYQIVVHTQTSEGENHTIGMRRSKQDLLAKIDGNPIRTQAELSHYLPVQIIHPKVAELLTEGPAHRRRYLDWGVFHVKHQYLSEWRRFQQSLKLRNAALKKQASKEVLESFDEGFVKNALLLNTLRSDYFHKQVLPMVKRLLKELLENSDLDDLEISYYPGWSGELKEALKRSQVRDKQYQTTHVGPQRSDIKLQMHGVPVTQVLSSGQLKLIAIGMRLAQLQLIQQHRPNESILLIDDISAELDEHHQALVYQQALQSVGQLWVTALSEPKYMMNDDQLSVFHVKHSSDANGMNRREITQNKPTVRA